jgi:hypothetical protein
LVVKKGHFQISDTTVARSDWLIVPSYTGGTSGWCIGEPLTPVSGASLIMEGQLSCSYQVTDVHFKKKKWMNRFQITLHHNHLSSLGWYRFITGIYISVSSSF